jgi:hypothetical protein
MKLWWRRPWWLYYRPWFFRVYDLGHGDKWYRAQLRFPFLARLNP